MDEDPFKTEPSDSQSAGAQSSGAQNSIEQPTIPQPEQPPSEAQPYISQPPEVPPSDAPNSQPQSDDTHRSGSHPYISQPRISPPPPGSQPYTSQISGRQNSGSQNSRPQNYGSQDLVTPPVVAVKQDKFSLDEVLNFGWESTWNWQRLTSLVGIDASSFFMVFGPQLIIFAMNSYSTSTIMYVLSAILELCTGLLTTIVMFGKLNVWLRVADGQTTQTRDLFSKAEYVWRYAGATFLYYCMVIPGLIFFVAPGVFLHIRFQFYGYLIVEYGLGPFDALKGSWEITKGAGGPLLLFGVVTWFISSIGGMFFLLCGPFFAGLIINLATARLYKSLVQNTPMESLSYFPKKLELHESP